MKTIIYTLLFSLCLLFATHLQAESHETHTLSILPKQGDSMDKVLAQFGIPGNEIPWVGSPPITRWVYLDFTVYFEYKRVISSVKHAN